MCSIRGLKLEWMTLVMLVICWPPWTSERLCRQWNKCRYALLADSFFQFWNFLKCHFAKCVHIQGLHQS